MLKAAMITVLSTSLTATGWAAPIETATRPGTPPRGPERVSPQTPAAPPAAPAPAPPAAPAPAPGPAQAPPTAARERAKAAREAARVRSQTRAMVGRGQQRGSWVEATGDPLTATFSGRNGDVLELTNTMGTIVVSTGRSGEGRIVAHRKASGRTDQEARALLERMQLTVKQHAQRIVVKAEPAPEAAMFSLDYEVTLPKGMGIDVKNLSGAITLSSITGDVRVETMSGDISGKGLARLRSLRTMSGDIHVSGSTLVGEASLQTVSGDVVAAGLKAASLTLGTVSGDIQLRDAGCERVQVQTVNGDIEFASAVMDGGRYELKTHAGDILVAPAARGAGYEFEAQTFKGRIRSDVDGAGEGQRQVRGRIGDGSAFFELTSFTGDIHIRK